MWNGPIKASAMIETPLILLLMVLTLLASGVIAALRSRRSPYRRWRHQRRINQAEQLLDELQERRNQPGLVFHRLRHLHPNAFEELVLSAYERQGHRVKRNHRYTGDDGSDGVVWLDGVKHLVQAKRYAAHIDAQQVREFGQLCQRRQLPGLFVHTGKTGKGARQSLHATVRMVSGQGLLTLVLNPLVAGQSDKATGQLPPLNTVGKVAKLASK